MVALISAIGKLETVANPCFRRRVSGFTIGEKSLPRFQMQKPTIIDQLTNAVSAACAPVGIRKGDISTSPRGLAIPSCGIVMTLKLVDSNRVWNAVEHLSILSFGGDDERKTVKAIFEVPFGSEWQAARKLAMYIAEKRINAAIDAATTSATG
jgi:hypothetical protein